MKNINLTRRRFAQFAGISAAGAIATACAPTAFTTAVPTVAPTRTPEPPITNGDEALQRLMRGNQRFVAELALNPSQTRARREQTAGGQMPFAIILGCSDSRVTPEYVFDQGIGDLFVVRVAGNVFDDNVALGSIEYAVEHFHSPLLLVLGHEKCGAVEATIETLDQTEPLPGKIGEIVKLIRPAAEQTKGQAGDWLDHAVRANVLHVVEQLKKAAPFISKLQADGTLKIVGAYYALKTGAVEILNT